MSPDPHASRHASPPESSSESSQTPSYAIASGAAAREVPAEGEAPAQSGDAESETSASRETESENGVFPIVGIGASAGGLDAFRSLLHHLPTRTGMAFV
ncbi:MAG: hypothetical protein EOM22_06005, partial [Gammaproteobacteria bacterium]|nr:hypothetical protein [Gammaproteobacteria bacterium]